MLSSSSGFIVGENGVILHTNTGGVPQQPPEIPQKPSGPHMGFLGKRYIYMTSAMDANGEDVYYQWDWGDGTISEWFGPFPIDRPVKAFHHWNDIGTFSIKVRAKDPNDLISRWSDSQSVIIQSYNLDISAI
jgi:hypothetical protein